MRTWSRSPAARGLAWGRATRPPISRAARAARRGAPARGRAAAGAGIRPGPRGSGPERPPPQRPALRAARLRDRRPRVRIAVCSPQVPFSHGGAEVLAEQLVDELNAREHQAALVTVPFKWYPGERVLTQAFLWRLLDLEETDGRPIDLVIATKFPSYVVRHPRKVVWLVHQLRQAYELDRTGLGQFGESPEERALRRKVHRLDRVALGEARKLCAI